MSLVVCSNIKDEVSYNPKDINSAPYRFHNSLKQTFKIPKNSEVAVQSVKINKSSSYNISRNDKWYEYWGPELLTLKRNSKDTPYRPISCFPKIVGDLPSESVGLNDFIQRIEDAINVGIPHPDYYGLQTLGSNIDATTNDFLGYKIGNKASSVLATEQKFATKFNAVDNWSAVWDQSDDALTFVPGVSGGADPVIKRTAPLSAKTDSSQNSLELRNMPLSHKRGEVTFDLTGMMDTGAKTFQNTWQIGLVREIDRNTTYAQGNSEYGDPINFDERFSTGFIQDGATDFGDFFFDIVVSCEGLVSGGPKKLKVHHATSNEELVGDDALSISLQEIDYYSWAGAPTEWGSDRYDIRNNPLELDRLTFRVENEIVSIIASLANSTGVVAPTPFVRAEVVLTSFHQKSLGATKPNYPIPMGQLQWDLYPRLIINGLADGSTAREVSVLSYKTNPESTYNNYAFNNPDNSYTTRLGRTGQQPEYMELNRRAQYLFRGAGYADTYVYQGLTYDDPATPTTISAWKNPVAASPEPATEDRNLQLVLSSATLYYEDTQGANLAARLGFEEDPILVNTYNGKVDGTDPLLYNFLSSELPSAHQTKSLFVRLDNFTQQSLNAGVGRPSKILYHIPRFDDSGRDHGTGLFFEPSERTYIKLNNSNDLYMNELQLSIANDDERLAVDLVGKTIICLHFKQTIG
tara:strand:- start:1922 stop:3997 length:2076 start_codon:yes stop_codon:yes gene_type:complete